MNLFFLLMSISYYSFNNPIIIEKEDTWLLGNTYLNAVISKDQCKITGLTIDNKNLLNIPCSVDIPNDLLQNSEYHCEYETRYLTPGSAEVIIRRIYDDITIEHTFVIDSQCLLWQVEVSSKSAVAQEVTIDFRLPLLKMMDHIFYPAANVPFAVHDIELMYRLNTYIPVITAYSLDNNIGLSIISPFNIAKPSLSFSVISNRIIVSYSKIHIAREKSAKAAVIIVPHDGDWRPGLKFLLQRYPEYFYPSVEKTTLGEGWFVQGRTTDEEPGIKNVALRGATWNEFHYYFPFYGLYVPKRSNWGLVYNSDNVRLSDWEQGSGKVRNTESNMHNLIDLWHRYEVQVYLYFQVFEAWHQYAEKYFPEDIARDEMSNPLPSWKFTNLMNPNPESKWGKYIVDQAKKLIKEYPSIDGIFYDRMDYWKYDFAHDDGLTMISNEPVYMLGFAQEKINDIIFNIFHKHNKGIWGNGPTSAEVCKNLDGIMAEGSLRNLYKIQYLGLARPIIYYPYDRTEKQTEEKLKNALLCGAFPSITLGGDKCQTLDLKYKPLFNLLKGRTWFLNAHSVEIPTGFKSNIFKTPEGDYVVVVISPEKSQLVYHPFEYEIPVTINVPDANEINNAYLLSGDWSGINELPFKKKKGSIHIDLPQHLSSSLIYLTKKSKHDVVRLSSTILIKGQSNELIFKVYNRSADNNPVFKITTPWFDKTKKVLSDIVKFQTMVPDGIKGEVKITVNYNGKDYKYTNWLVEPVSIVPKEDIFVQCRHGENIPFYCVNNLPTKTTVNLAGKLITGHGKIKAPKKIILKPRESREIDIFVESGNNGVIQLNMSMGEKTFTKTFPVKTGLSFSNNDLFHDDFKYGMKKWMIYRGEWQVSNNVAMAEGSSHFAFIQSNTWNDYVVEAKTVCRGSNNPVIDWLKCYIFFRLQDEKNFYRFGIHGDAGVIDLYKCVNGKWGKLSSSVFMPKKDKWYALRIQVRETKITGFLNGHKILEANDGTFPSGGIGIGVLEDAMRCEYKDIVVKKF